MMNWNGRNAEGARSAAGAGSGFVHFDLDLLDFLLHEFPDARFLLTIRDCYSWLIPMFNQSLRFRGNWIALGEADRIVGGPGARDYAAGRTGPHETSWPISTAIFHAGNAQRGSARKSARHPGC